jgi:hypothetical protein
VSAPLPDTLRKRLGPGGWFILIALLALLAASVFYALDIWNAMDVGMSGWGWGFLIAGVVVSVGLGGGLMALVFYSSRHDYDR